jgi:hypothetical protein
MLATGVNEKGETTGTPAASIHVASMGANPTLGDMNVVDVRFLFPFQAVNSFEHAEC